MAGGVVYHWKHGYIPLDHYAALKKAHGSQHGAAKIMSRHGISDGPKSLHSADRSNGGKGPKGGTESPKDRIARQTNETAAKHGLPFRHGDTVRLSTAGGGDGGVAKVHGLSADGHYADVITPKRGLERVWAGYVHPVGKTPDAKTAHVDPVIAARDAAARRRRPRAR